MTCDRLLLFVLLAAVLSPASAPAQEETEKAPAPLSAALVEVLDVAIANPGGVLAASADVFDRFMVELGDLDGCVGELDERLKAETLTDVARGKLLRLKARLLRRFGDLKPALEALEAIPEEVQTTEDLTSRAEVLDAAGRDEDARALYEKLVPQVEDEEAKNRLLLRVALLTEKEAKAERTPLAVFAAEEGRAEDLRNQAAMILALQREQKEAVEIYALRGEKTKLFRQLIRLSEWALEAKDWEKAQSYSWRATKAAELKRDRRYALTILVDSYRSAKQLDDLIARFTAEAELTDEARKVWIDLLRETGRIDAALALFRDSHDGDFTVEMRRELLDMCRETGRDETLVGAYEKLIADEPRFVEWREGLCRFHLERGNRAAAEKVWTGFREAVEREEARVMAAADVLGRLGLDDLAASFVTEGFEDPESQARARLFLFELHFGRGRLEEAEAELAKLDEVAPPEADVRMDLAGAYERLGQKKRAVEILRGLSETKGDLVAGDMEMKLALLLSDVGEEEEALERWTRLWHKLESIPRRRYVEDRMMTVASRLGTLAKIVIDLEKRLADGRASRRDSGLLVRLYTRVKDAVSATDIIDEYMKQTSGDPIETLAEKARVYLSCLDYFNYEQTIETLVEVDPENAPDYFRQLAMSRLERGKRKEAREILERLKEQDADSASEEFEAGVLALAGMREEAVAAYRKAIARHPGRIDNYLLLSNVMKEIGQFDRSAGMFQYLAQTADRDDLFTIAIDGILNMRDGRRNAGAPDRLVRWARRITLERLARRPDKLYLYQLVSDLSVEIDDKATAIRALKSALPVAGEQRTQLLRELMSMAKPNRSNSVTYIVVGGQLVQRGAGDLGDLDAKKQQLMFGRRLLGQGELVPPGVYLELGETFLAAEEVSNASRTFNQASKLPDFASFQRKIASSFETARYPEEALRVYERILTVETSDLSLLTRVAELREKLGYGDVARDLYLRALALMLSKQPFDRTRKEEKEEDDSPFAYNSRNRNVSDTDAEVPFIQRGLLTSLSPDQGRKFLSEIRGDIDADMSRIEKSEKERTDLTAFPRLQRRVALHRRFAVAFEEMSEADRVDLRLLKLFAEDEKLLEALVRFRVTWGFNASARRLIADSGRPEKDRKRLDLLAGGEVGNSDSGLVTASEVTSLCLPLVADEREREARLLLERLDFGTGEKDELEHLPTLASVASFLDAQDSTLAICRHWINVAVKHAKGSLYSVIEGILQHGQVSLDSERRKSLVQHLVSAMVEKPEKFSSLFSRLPDLQRTLGMELMTPEQVQKLVTSRLEENGRSIYGIPELLMMTPADGRVAIFRGIWPKVDKESRTDFIFKTVGALENEASESLADFLAGNFASSLEDIKNDFVLNYGPSVLVRSAEHNVALRKRLLDHLIEHKPGEARFELMRAQLVVKSGKIDEGFEMAKKPLIELLELKKPPYQVSSAVDDLLETLAKTHFDQLIALLDEAEEKEPSPQIALRRVTLLEQKKDPEAVLAALRAAIEKHPKDTKLRQRLRSELSNLGRLREMVEVQQGIVDVKPDDKKATTKLIADWKRVHNPVKALAIMKEGEKKKAANEEEEDAGNKKKPRERATAKTLKAAYDANDHEESRRIFHEMWRRFPDRNARYFRGYMRPIYLRSWKWPLDEDEKPDKEKKEASRGGLPDLGPIKKEKKGKKKDERRTVTAVMAKTDYGAQEIERLLRALDAPAFNGAEVNNLLGVEAARRVENVGRAAAIEEILAASRNGYVGRAEFGILFALLEGLTAESSEETRDSVDELIRVVSPTDSGQIRRLARLHATLGDADKAALLWRWSVKVNKRNRFSWGVPRDLVDEIIECLDGDARNAVLEEIFRATAPSDDYSWGHDSHARQVLDTWIEVAGPDAAWELCGETLEKVLELRPEPRRNAARTAARLAARRGEHEKALRYLEIALLKLEVPPGTDSWSEDDYTRSGSLPRRDLRLLFPAETEGWKDPVAWLDIVAGAVPGWLEEDRVDPERLFELYAVLALRYFENERPEEANAWLVRVAGAAGTGAARRLWVADLARRFGDTERADRIERDLLTRGELHLERLDDVISTIAETEGAEPALAAGDPVTEWCLHPDLLDVMVRLAEEEGRDVDAARLKTKRDEAAAARKELEDRKKTE